MKIIGIKKMRNSWLCYSAFFHHFIFLFYTPLHIYVYLCWKIYETRIHKLIIYWFINSSESWLIYQIIQSVFKCLLHNIFYRPKCFARDKYSERTCGGDVFYESSIVTSILPAITIVLPVFLFIKLHGTMTKRI